MSQFFISCKESRIETNRSFYGSFYLGPFEPSQSITIANALRRTLLSDIYGLGIVSVEIDGASHEYSSLPGIRDSVLDILLNLKEIVLKKTIKNFKPQIGYLRVYGPGIVRASHLRLPPFIQCVDPNQYIATLAENGFLNMKFVIQYGNKWLWSQDPLEKSKEFNSFNNSKIESPSAKTNEIFQNPFNVHLRKRRLILKKLKNISFHSDTTSNKDQYLTMFSKNTTFLKTISKKKSNKKLILKNLLNRKYPAINLKIKNLKKLNKYDQLESKISQNSAFDIHSQNSVKKIKFFNSKPLTIDSVFNPINKVNYLIEVNDFKESPSKLQSSSETMELYDMLETNLVNSVQKSHEELKSLSSKLSNEITQHEIENVLELKRDINSLTKETLKHNITLEIWTNGSIHPRDALYQSFKNLIKLFSKLSKIDTFGVTNFDLVDNSSSKMDLISNFNKKNKLGEIENPLFQDLIPLNESSFLSTYTSPNLKNYYLNNQAFQPILKNSLFKNDQTKDMNLLSMDPKNQLKPLSQTDFLNADIGILNLSLRNYTTLKRCKINTIQELIKFSKKNLLKIGNSNHRKLDFNEIEISLKKINLNLKD